MTEEFEMTNRFLRVALVVALAGSLAACNNNNRGGGGGGNAGSGRTTTEQAKSNMAMHTMLRSDGKELADAYAHVPWIHANLAAGDWERALDDLQTVQKKLDAIKNDKHINATVKAKIEAVKPQMAILTTQIQKHDKTATRTTVVLLEQFAKTMNDPVILTWIGPKGGGAGR
jgi:hypothetical protein